MNTASSYFMAATFAAVLYCGSSLAQDQEIAARDGTKEVLSREGGKERHWVIRSGQLITEEHYLTAHGDMHVVVEYPKGVRKAQVDSKDREKDMESVVKGFWPNGKLMFVTQQVGEKANGRDVVYWPSGKTAREALFTMGVPTGAWKFYDVSGKPVGEGKYQDGKRWSGTFVGTEERGGVFLLAEYPIKKQSIEGGVVKREEEFLQEDFIEKAFPMETEKQ